MSATDQTKGEKTVAGYLGDLIAVTKHVGEAVARHAKDERVHRIPNARKVLEDAYTVLSRHLQELEAYGKTSVGIGPMGAVKGAVTSVTEFVTGLYGTIRGEAASRMLRDDYTGISFVMVCTQMLHTTARAVGEVTISTTLVRHLEQLAQVIIRINAVLPHAVVADLAADGEVTVNSRAAEETGREQAHAWRWAEKSEQ